MIASFSYRKRKRERMLRKMAAMRAAKERKRLERGPRDEEPRMVRWHPLEIGVRDKATGEVAFTDFRSIRDAARRLREVFLNYP